MRPGGPRSRRPNHTFKPSTSTAPSEHEDESLPGYSGSNSPAVSSLALSSPVAPAFEPAQEPAVLQSLSASEPRGHQEQAIQTDLPAPISARAPTPAVKVILKAPTLTPPAAVNFDSVPIAWRGMTLESAKWNMTSEQLQVIVSRAIRRTAQESFIRLLPVQTIDEELVAELERLDTVGVVSFVSFLVHRICQQLKATTQSQYRFNLHRRTMLLQSLLALATNEDYDCAVLCNLTTQLADITSTCDQLMTDLLRVTDQKAQIHRIQDVHISSALAMALRKLNASYAKRTAEVREARERADQLKAELDEAWAVAQEMAEEMDELENFHSGFSSDEDDRDDERRLDDSVRMAEVIGITGRAVAMKATLTQLEAARIREYHSGRTSRVSAARKRSSLASKASLRLPKSTKSSVVDVASLSSRLSTRRSMPRRSSGAASTSPSISANAPALPIDARVRKAPKDDSFLDLSSKRQPQPPPPSYDFSAASTSSVAVNDKPLSTNQLSSSHIQQPSLDFIVPPISVHPVDDDELPNPHSAEDDGARPLPSIVPRRRPSRRVHSLQPAQRSLEDAPDADRGELKRTASERRRANAWPWAGGDTRVARRQSMPLSPTLHDGDGEGASVASVELSPSEGRQSDSGHGDPVPFPTGPPVSISSRVLPTPPPLPPKVFTPPPPARLPPPPPIRSPPPPPSPASLQTGSSSSGVFSLPSSILSTAPP